MMDPKLVGKPITAQYQPGRSDLDQMPDTPNRRAHHRRAQSETFFRFSDVDDLLLDDVVMAPDFGLDLPADNPPMAVDSSKSESSNGPDNSSRQNDRPVGPAPTHHFRSLSVDDGFFDGLNFTSSVASATGTAPPDSGETDRFAGKPASAIGGGVGVGTHRHSNSMDGSSTGSFDVDSTKKAMAADKLAELALIDPKRAKRILANRQSAARSKERKIRYANELEKKVQTLQTEATTLSAQVTMLQRDTTGLTAENKELKLRLQAMEQQAHLRDALNEALREEVQRLKIAAGQIPAANGNNFNRAVPPQFSARSQNFHHFGNQPSQQNQQTTANQSLSGQTQPSFLDFNQRA